MLKDLALSDTGFVFNPYTGATFSVNPTGLAILQGLKDDLDRNGLLDRLRDGFDIKGEDLHRDLDEFTHLLQINGLLPKEAVL